MNAENNLMKIPYLFFANPTSFPDWQYEERYGVGLDIDLAWYRAKRVWRYKVLKGSYKDYVFEIDREKALKSVIRGAIPSGKCHDIIPISEMVKIAPKVENTLKI